MLKKSGRPLFDEIVKGCLKLQMVQFIFACSPHPKLRWLAQGQDGIKLAKENVAPQSWVKYGSCFVSNSQGEEIIDSAYFDKTRAASRSSNVGFFFYK